MTLAAGARALTKPVSDLAGAELDYWVAKAEGQPFRMGPLGPEYEHDHISGYRVVDHLNYSGSWGLAGPIIERERITVTPTYLPEPGEDEWEAGCANPDDKGNIFTPGGYCSGATPLIAAMRYYVASKFGDTVGAP